MTSDDFNRPGAAARGIVAELLAFIDQDGCSDDAFDALALRLFAHQHAHNEAYRRFCQRRGATLRSVKGWRDIPAVPIDAFKELGCAASRQRLRTASS